MADERESGGDPRVDEALTELQSYLSDAISPLVVAESLEILLTCPPRLVAREIDVWTAAQYRRQDAAVPISDYLFHAVRKIHLVGEFKLLPPEALDLFLAELKLAVLEACPKEDRETLRGHLERLDEASTALTQPVAILHRRMGTEQPLAEGDGAPPGAPAGPAATTGSHARTTAESFHSQRRLGVLLHRLDQQLNPEGGSPAPDGVRQPELAARLLAQAASTSSSPEELGQFRDGLRLRGLEARLDEVFRVLSQQVPDWSPPGPTDAARSGSEPFSGGAAGAMRRLLGLDQDPVEGAKRFIAMVEAAIEQANAGSLARAATMLDLANHVLSERRTDAVTVQAFLEHAHEKLDQARLRTAAEDAAKHEALARILAFFPATTATGLLDALQGEPRRERRRHLLSLLEAHGTRARALAWQRLQESMSTLGDQDAFLQRNLLLLLRRIPRPEGTSLEEEVSVATALSSPAHPLTLVKEAVAYLGGTKHPKAEQALILRAGELEHLILHPDMSPYRHEDLLSAFDRVIYALARFGTAEGHRVAVDHGLKQQPQLGDSGARLAYLGGQDLAEEPDTVSRLLVALEAELPRKILGISVRSSPERALHLIDALSSTPVQVVRSCLVEVAARFRGQPLGGSAGRALAGFEAARASAQAPPLALAGDVESFGLPNLLQHLAQNEACGALTITDTSGRPVATLSFDGGLLVRARHGRIEGEAAVYQLLERPVVSTFQFVGRRAVAGQPRSGGRDVLPLLLEGQRRYDELLALAPVITDEATFKAGEVKGSVPDTEGDTAMVQSVWLAAVSGACVSECESDHAVDSYRVRRLLGRWVDEGALAIR